MAGHISKNFIQELLSRIDIVDVINSRVPLTPAGREYKACCPFHNEKTPSFYVSPVKQFYHCFGCGESGTAIQFLMNYGNYQFLDAIEELASIAGLEVPKGYVQSHQQEGYTQLLELMEKINAEYQRQLYKNPESAAAREYLKERGITFEAAQEFGLGFAPNEWSFVQNKYGKTKNDLNMLERAGLIVVKKDSVYDRFRGRLMFPIEDRRGRVIAFGGRVISEGEPKYLNSPETILFKKSNELFGFKKALQAIKTEEKVLVVEGYTDVIVLAQYGVNYAVATLGTAVTPSHVKQLLRTIHNVVFCFDGDEAGVRAAWRAVESTLPVMEDGHLVSFVFLPEGEDPDSMVRREGGEAYRERMSNGEPIAEFIFRTLLEQSDISRTDGRARFAAEFGKVISGLRPGMLRQMMLSDLATRTGLSESAIKSVLETPTSEHSASRSKPAASIDFSLTGQFISLLIQYPQFVKYVTELKGIEKLRDSNIRLLVVVLKTVQKNPELNTASLVEKFRGTDYFAQVKLFAISRDNYSEAELEQKFKGIVMKIQERIIKQENQLKISQSDHTLDDEELQDFLQRLRDQDMLKKNVKEGRNIH